MKTPVALFVYNRPHHTAMVLESLSQIQPENLYVIADGPKDSADAGKVRETRSLIDSLSWPATVRKEYSKVNLGCEERVNTGLDWVFSRVPRAIVIEDDILAEPCFFYNTSKLLERYEGESSIKSVTGRNQFVCSDYPDADYFVAHKSSIWGWGTWADRWHLYRSEFPTWTLDYLGNQMQKSHIPSENKRLQLYLYKHQIAQKLNTWDMQWSQWIMASNGLCLIPVKNLVKNIGFDASATHTGIEGDVRGAYPVFNDLTSETVDATYDQKGVEYDRSFFIYEMLFNYNSAKQWALLSRNFDRMKLPGNRDGWELMLTPFRNPKKTYELLLHMNRMMAHPQIRELLEVFERQVND